MRRMRAIMSSFLMLGLVAGNPSNSSFGLTARHGMLENVPRVPGLALSGGRDNDRERDWGQGHEDRYDNMDPKNNRNNDNRYQDRDSGNDQDRYGDEYSQREGFENRDRFYDSFDDRDFHSNNRDRYNDGDRYKNRDRYDDRDRYDVRDRYDDRHAYENRNRYNNRESFDNRFHDRDNFPINDWDRYSDRGDGLVGDAYDRDGVAAGEVDDLFPHLSPPCSALLNPLHSALLRDSSSLRVKQARTRTSAIVSGLNSFTVTSCATADEGALNLEMIFNELTISTGMEGRAAEARHVLDSTNRRDDIVLEGERGRFSLDEGRDRITVQVYSVPLSYLYISSRLAGRGQADSAVRLRDRSLKYRVDLMPPNERNEHLARALFAEVQEDLEEQLEDLLASIIGRIRLTATRSLQQTRFKRSAKGRGGSRQRGKGSNKGGREARMEARRRERQSRRFETKQTGGCSCRMRRDTAEMRLAKISGSSRREERVEARRSRRLQSKGRGGPRRSKGRRCACKGSGGRGRERPGLPQSDPFYH